MLERGVADVFINEVYVIEVVGKHEGTLQLIFCGGEANE